jgi:hypothetical protein
MTEAHACNSDISHYYIISKIGAGALDEVYRALGIRLNREVAINDYIRP